MPEIVIQLFSALTGALVTAGAVVYVNRQTAKQNEITILLQTLQSDNSALREENRALREENIALRAKRGLP